MLAMTAVEDTSVAPPDAAELHLSTPIKPRLRGWLHAVMFPATLFAGVVLTALADSPRGRIACAVYTLSACLLFGVSALYHRGTWGPRATAILRRLDHANIFLIIAGTYTPFAILLLPGGTASELLWFIWAGALAGIAFRVFWVGAPRWLYTPCYLALGWAAVFFLPDFLHAGGVAVLVCVAGWRLGKRTVDTLTDVAPAGAAELITTTAAKVPGVVRVDQVRARAVGETTFVDLAVAVSRTLPIDRVDAIRDAVAAALRAGMPGAEPVVTTHPVALNNETVLDRVMVIARNRALAVHHVTVHELRDKLTVSLDLEVDGRLSLRAAHEMADALESAIESELGVGVEVETHIEPLQPQDVTGREALPERVGAVSIALSELAAEGRVVRDVHDVRVRETDDGEIVNFHCRVDPALTVHDVHDAVDALERALKLRSPQIKRVVGHAEPMR